MNWSRYNLLFRSKKHGHLLYSSLTNTFARLDEETAAEVEKIRQEPAAYDFTERPELFLQLVLAKVLVEPWEEEALVRVIRLRRLYERFDASAASFTIVPTLACNFDCTYCYERFRRPVHMSEEVEDHLIAFVRNSRTLQCFDVEWYGGEPTLRFETMRRLSGKLDGLGLPWSASLVTNGYLLTSDVVQELDRMRIRSIQITLDGPAEVHDSRRKLAGGGATHETILKNVAALLEGWSGDLVLRVNVDHSNRNDYFAVRKDLLDRFPDKKLTIYPGIVVPSFDMPHGSCTFDRDDACRFQVDAYRRHGVDDLGFYPTPRSGCTATRKNGFVIGPTGEIYKCYVDIGIRERVVGNIRGDEPWNLGLLSAYMVGSEAFEIPECRDCFFVPLCDGGCPNARLKGGRFQEHVSTCVEYKEMLPEWLEIHYEIKQKASGGAP